MAEKSIPTPAEGEDLPEELQPTVLLMSVMIKVKCAPVVDEEDQETIVEKLAEFFNEHFDDAVSMYMAADDNEMSELDESDAELISENVVFEVSD